MGSFYRSQHELIFMFKHGTELHINNVEFGIHGRYRTNVWCQPGVNTSGEENNEKRVMNLAREGVAEIERVKNSMGSIAFYCQCQQDPLAPGGNIVKWEWFKTYEWENSNMQQSMKG